MGGSRASSSAAVSACGRLSSSESLNRFVPRKGAITPNLGNYDLAAEVVVAVTGGKLDFWPWDQIFYGEFDGRRRKRVLVKIIGARLELGARIK